MAELVGTDILYRHWQAAAGFPSPRAVFLGRERVFEDLLAWAGKRV